MTSVLQNAEPVIGVVGLGYVGLPLAVEFGGRYRTIGFDTNGARIDELHAGKDSSLEVSEEELRATTHLSYTTRVDDLRACNVYVVTVPTPITQSKTPDLAPLISASTLLGKVVARGDVVIYESTVYPGATEEVCVPLLEAGSGLKMNEDFFVGYSPERINPGDKEHRLRTIKKVTAGSTPEAADFVDTLYGSIIDAGTHKASSIRVAEAAKVIENTQRDVNIALINELALIFNRLGMGGDTAAACHQLDHLGGDEGPHAVVEPATSQDDLWVVADLLGLVGQIIGVDTDAVSTDQARTEGEEVPLATGCLQHLLGVDAKPIEDQR
jgi:UDP-N-acetyl-D-galactosamine dehydrogenase